MTDEETPGAPRTIQYRVDAEADPANIIRRDIDGTEITIARYDTVTGQVAYLPGMGRYRVQVQRHLNDKNWPMTGQVQLDNEADVVPEPKAPAKPPPPQDPRAGDKTPAYMRWLQENRPEEFRARYGVVGATPDGTPITMRKTPITQQAQGGAIESAGTIDREVEELQQDAIATRMNTLKRKGTA